MVVVWVLVALILVSIVITWTPGYKRINEEIKEKTKRLALVDSVWRSKEVISHELTHVERSKPGHDMADTLKQLDFINKALGTKTSRYDLFLDKYAETITLVNAKVREANEQSQLRDKDLHTLLQEVLGYMVDDIKIIQKKHLNGITHDLTVEAEVLRKMREGSIWTADVKK